MTPERRTGTEQDKGHDPVLDGYGEWLGDLIYEAKFDDGEAIIWLGGNRWAIFAPSGPDVLVIEIKRGTIEVAE